MSEWLRRVTRNQMGSSRDGSNPADFENIYLDLKISQLITYKMLAYSQFHSFESVKKVTRNDGRVEKKSKKEQNVIFFQFTM